MLRQDIIDLAEMAGYKIEFVVNASKDGHGISFTFDPAKETSATVLFRIEREFEALKKCERCLWPECEKQRLTI
jgi:hypothetical protein